jgi:hypothetical protein
MAIADVNPPAQNCGGSPADDGSTMEKAAAAGTATAKLTGLGFPDAIEAEGGAQCATADTRPLPRSQWAEFEAARVAMLRAWCRCCAAGADQRDEPGATASAMRQIAHVMEP